MNNSGSKLLAKIISSQLKTFNRWWDSTISANTWLDSSTWIDLKALNLDFVSILRNKRTWLRILVKNLRSQSTQWLNQFRRRKRLKINQRMHISEADLRKMIKMSRMKTNLMTSSNHWTRSYLTNSSKRTWISL